MQTQAPTPDKHTMQTQNTPTKPARVIKPKITAILAKPNAKKPATQHPHQYGTATVVARGPMGYASLDGKPAKTGPVEALTARFYFNKRGNGMNPIRCSVWIRRPTGSGLEWHSGTGSASGCGYHKESTALADALMNAGVQLLGDPYGRDGTRNKKPLHFAAMGDSRYSEILFSVARAAGFKGPMILVKG